MIFACPLNRARDLSQQRTSYAVRVSSQKLPSMPFPYWFGSQNHQCVQPVTQSFPSSHCPLFHKSLTQLEHTQTQCDSELPNVKQGGGKSYGDMIPALLQYYKKGPQITYKCELYTLPYVNIVDHWATLGMLSSMKHHCGYWCINAAV